MATKKGPVFRVTGLPAEPSDDELEEMLRLTINDNLLEEEQSKLDIKLAIAPSCSEEKQKIALVEFRGGVPTFLSELKSNPLEDWQVEMGDIDINFDSHFFGFTQLYTPKPNTPITADVIAITGLDGHAYGSWRSKKNLGRMWLRDFLYKDLPSCRTMIYGYNSKLSTRGIDSIMDYGRELIEELKKIRNTEKLRQRPLFFIAHSFGGIILAHCLVKAAPANEDDDDPTMISLYRATYGMLLFGIPHKGLVVDDIQKMLAGQENHPRTTLLDQIRTKSDLLANQLEGFKNIIRDRKIVSFFEKHQTRQLEFDDESKRWKRTGEFFTAVETDSALLQLPDSMEEKIPLDSDHSMMVKFDSINSRGYTSARDKLKLFEQNAPRIVAARFSNSIMNEKNRQCLRYLWATDLEDDKERIQQTKGGLLKDSYIWILENSTFREWREGLSNRLLWIKGDPGKGKTMLLCGIIDELKKLNPKGHALSFFFCQATDSRTSNAVGVLRGLVRQLINHQPSLIVHVRKEYDSHGKEAFEGVNAWIIMSRILTSVLGDQTLERVSLMIDALDECTTDQTLLLDLIVQASERYSNAEWIVSSRNLPDIGDYLNSATRLSLELNEKSISAAVSMYIQHRVDELAKLKGYDEDMQDTVQSYLLSNASNTFLWVALVCQELASPKVRHHHTRSKLYAFPPGLDPLYGRMIDQISNSLDSELCHSILATVSVVHRPITLDELVSFIDMPEYLKSLIEIIELCGSFLTVQGCTILFVHQSAKDFLVEKASNEVFPSGIENVHSTIFSRSLQVMSGILRRDIYNLKAPGFPTDQVQKPEPDPLAAVQYSCIHWVNHLHDCHSGQTPGPDGDFRKGCMIDEFLKESFLYWLEALSLLGGISEGVLSMLKLESLVQRSAGELQLITLIQDSHRFILYHKQAIENYPLQVYNSALIFSPTHSLIKETFAREEPEWITNKPIMEDNWSACLQTLEGHSHAVLSVVFSHDSKLLVSASVDKTIRIWDANSGKCLQTLEGHRHSVRSIIFSHDSKLLASASDDKTIRIWDTSSNKCLQTLEGHSSWVLSVVFSHDSKLLASASDDKTIRIWDASSGKCLQILKVGISLDTISFDITSSCLLTDIGTIYLSEFANETPTTISTRISSERLQIQDCGVSSDRTWITWNSENLLWLPSEYRPSCSAVATLVVSLGCHSGRVLIFNFDSRHLSHIFTGK